MRELEAHSCLTEDQSGGIENLALPNREELDIGVDVGAMVDRPEVRAEANVVTPRITRYYQGRAVSAIKRTKEDIYLLLIHTPEGGEPGTLSVLNEPNASFDWFLPPSGNLYRCNDYYNFVAWQAGHWETNLRSIGIEQGDYAARSGQFGDAHYRRLAQLCAYLTESLNLNIRRTRDRTSYGFISHADVTPGQRTDPGAGFLWDKLLDYTVDYRQGRTPGGDTGESTPPASTLYRVIAGTFKARTGAIAWAAEVRRKGFETALVFEDGYFRVIAGSFREKAGAMQRVKALKVKNIDAYILPTEESGSGKVPSDKTNQALGYGLELLKNHPTYKWWHDGDDCRKPGFWGAASVAPPTNTVRDMFCAGLINLMLRRIGKNPPKNGGIYDGGTRAYMLGYRDVMVPFKLDECRRGDVAFRDFQTGGYSDQGHIGVCLGGADDPILQSFSNGYPGVEPGLNKDWTAKQSHDGWYYTYRIPREAIWG